MSSLWQWSIQYYSETIESEVLALPSGLLARYLRLTDLMLEFGPNLGMPHTQSMGDRLFELRIKSKEGIEGVLLHPDRRANSDAALLCKANSEDPQSRT